ncbi:ionotropic receptor 21a [Bombyx mandarina]|uniref:Ionotropic receptor 21a n=1 Tax=Bombyx mandarina TaxID=7092 RepID=A0A6J2JSP4_BOMMA|nr:ionotropic receptor 21a [Bombyx mandarina]
MDRRSLYGLLFIFYIISSQEIISYHSESLLKNASRNLLWNKKITPIIKEHNDFAYHYESDIHFGNRMKNVKSKRAVDPVFHGHPKTREELWYERFLNRSSVFDQTPSLIKLIQNITLTYLNGCTPVILYDSQIKLKESYLFQNLLRNFPVSFVHGYINEHSQLQEPKLLQPVQECLHFIIFLSDVKVSAKVLGKQSESKVVVVARSSQWAVHEFLSSSFSRGFINLVVIGQSFKEDDDSTIESPYILYTHKLYTDGLGASKPVVLNSWSHGKFSRNVNLFPPKMTGGYAGHRFVVAAANQPPFVFRRIKSDLDGGNPRVVWDGIEIRLLHLLAEKNNFSIEIVEPQELHLGSGDAVAKEIAKGRADIGVAGMYLTIDRTREMDVTFAHSQDCAVFITLMSTALPRYRAILGPFHWHVWVALTLTYLFGMFPLAFSDKHTLRHLINNSGEIENMFWYVFGTFTNCFTFLGRNSWSKTDKITTRLLIGWYWIFTIIITSCYTGSIIAFVTLPMFPETVDSIHQLLAGFYRVGTLDRGGWERWFLNSSDPNTNKLLKKLELVPNVEAGIMNTTKAFFWPYAFLGSKAELEYIVQSNFTKTTSKRAVLHISNECFVPFGVTIGFPNNSLYTAKLNNDLRRMVQSGIVDKIVDEVRWEMQRSSTGKLLSAVGGSLKVSAAEEKGLTLEDTQGMFLLLAAGFLIAATALISEWIGGFSKLCRFRKKKNTLVNSSTKEDSINMPPTESKDFKTETESVLHFCSRSTSPGSNESLDGQIINVTEESIEIHKQFTSEWDSRRSSSVDLEKEVKEIFERDLRRRGAALNNCQDVVLETRQSTASNNAFGDAVK